MVLSGATSKKKPTDVEKNEISLLQIKCDELQTKQLDENKLGWMQKRQLKKYSLFTSSAAPVAANDPTLSSSPKSQSTNK